MDCPARQWSNFRANWQTMVGARGILGGGPGWGCNSPRLWRKAACKGIFRPAYNNHTGELIMDRLKDKVAIVTGGGAGIGRATCELFAEEGAVVVVAERDEPTGRETADRIGRNSGRAIFVPTDVADEASIRQMATQTVQAFGRIN